MHILFINNDGGGFAESIEVRNGISVGELFLDRMKGTAPSDFLIRVNRQPAIHGQVLQPNDRVTFTPTKIQGAALAA